MKTKIKELPIDQIYGNPNQPRKYFNVEKIKELSLSIQEHGLIQPITVKPDNQGKYKIVCGERRYRAIKLLEWAFIACHIIKVESESVDFQAMIENTQREDMTVLEEAKGYDYLIKTYGLSTKELGDKLGMIPAKQAWITMKLKLLDLKPEYQQLIDKPGGITNQMAMRLAKLSSVNQDKVITKMKKGKLETPQKFTSFCDGLYSQEQQGEMFEVKTLTPKEMEKIKTIEDKINKAIDNLNILQDDGSIKDLQNLDPNKCRKMADKLDALNKQIGIIIKQMKKKAIMAD